MDISSETSSLVICMLDLQFVSQFYGCFVFLGLISGLPYEDVGLNNL